MSHDSEYQQRSTDRTPREYTDVCIVGGGVAGGLVGYLLAKQGLEVTILEAGPRFDPRNRLDRMERALRPEFEWEDVWEMGGPRDRYTTSGEIDYRLNFSRVKGVGGTTLHWLGTTPRLHEKDFEMQSRYGLAADWPISYADLQPYYAEAESELGVAGARDNPFEPPREHDFPLEAFPPSYVDGLYAEACERLGITVHSVPQARNSESYDGRSRCLGFSTCMPVCPSGAKYSGDVHIRKAEAEGARVLDRVPVQSLEHDRNGARVESAVYITPDGERHRQDARVFIIACGAVETARLLLLSTSDSYPDGLGNSSGLVGKYFMEHPVVRTVGRLDEPTNQEPIGFFTSSSHQFYDHDEPSPGSIFLEFENHNPPSPLDTALHGGDDSFRQDLLDPFFGDEWGEDLIENEEATDLNTMAGIIASVEQLPQKQNQVSLNPNKTDDHGNPVPDVSLNLGSHELATMRRALEIQAQIIEEMGGEIVSTTDPRRPTFGSHHMGTTRMGNDPASSVVNPNLRSHDLENLFIASSSVFVTAGAMNPTLTIAALAVRLSKYISGEF